MRVFITGGSGFLGSALVSKLKADGVDCHAPSSHECNLLANDSLEAVASGKYDQIIHLAAWTQAGKFCLEHPCEQWIMNQHINTNVLDWYCFIGFYIQDEREKNDIKIKIIDN